MTRKQTTSYRGKGRAVFLAAIMVVSIVAMSAAFAGSAAANADEGELEFNDQALNEDGEILFEGLDSNGDAALLVTYENEEGEEIVAAIDDDDYDGENELVEVEDDGGFPGEHDAYLIPLSDLSDETEVGEELSEGDTAEAVEDPIDEDSAAVFDADINVDNQVAEEAPTNEIEIENASFFDDADDEFFVEVDVGDGPSGVSDIQTGEEEDIVVELDGDLDAGESDFTATLHEADGEEDPGDPVQIEEDTELENLDDEASIIVGADDDGSVIVDVREEIGDGDTEAYEDAEIDLFATGTDGDDDFDNTLVDTGTSNEDGEHTFTGVPVGSTEEPIDYRIEVEPREEDADLLSADTGTAQLDTDSDAASIDAVLRSDEEPQEIGVAVFDEEEEEIIGNESSLLADGELENTQTYVAYSQTQNEDDPAVNEEVEVDLSTAELDPTSGTGDVWDIAAFLDDEGNATDELTLSIDPDSNASEIDGEEVWSYETFEVSADNATEENMTDGDDIEPIVSNLIQGETDAIDGDDGQDAANVTYVLEGDETVTGEIRDGDTNDPIEDADVWVAYDSQADQSFDEVSETFVDEQDEPFLSTESAEDGSYTISGLAGEETDFNLYVQYTDEYNNINLTEEDAGQFVAATNQNLDTGAENDQVTQDAAIFEEDVVFDYEIETFVEEDGEWVNETDIPIENSTEVLVEANRAPQDDPDQEFDDPAPGQDIELELTNNSAGSLASEELTTDENGTETTTFTAGTSDEETFVNATTENVEGEEFETNETQNAFINVFGVGQITGDVVDENDRNIPDADVNLFAENETTEQFEDEVDTTVTGDEGSFSFVDVPSGEDYQVEAEFEDDEGNEETGFTTLEDLATGTTNADIVIEGVEAPEGFNIDDLEAPESAAPGEDIEVTAELTNTAGEEDTVTVAYEFDEDVELEEDVTLEAGETDSVTFEFEVPDVEEGDYDHGVTTDIDEAFATLTVTEDGENNDFDVSDYETEDGEVETEGLRDAIGDWRDDGIETDDLREVIAAWRSS